MIKDEFQTVADEANFAVQDAIRGVLEKHGRDGLCNGVQLAASIAGAISAAGVICGTFEDYINGNVLAKTVKSQFNAGRTDAKRNMRLDATNSGTVQ
jgi:hypothetical protein